MHFKRSTNNFVKKWDLSTLSFLHNLQRSSSLITCRCANGLNIYAPLTMKRRVMEPRARTIPRSKRHYNGDFPQHVKIARGNSRNPFLVGQIAVRHRPENRTRARNGFHLVDLTTCANIRFLGNTRGPRFN